MWQTSKANELNSRNLLQPSMYFCSVLEFVSDAVEVVAKKFRKLQHEIVATGLLVGFGICEPDSLLVYRQHRTRGKPFHLDLEQLHGLLFYQSISGLCSLKGLHDWLYPFLLPLFCTWWWLLGNLVLRVECLQHIDGVL